MASNTKSIVYSKNVVEFVTVANEYCGFLENAAGFNKDVFVEKSLKIIALLYLKASMLPIVEVDEDEDVESFVTEFDWKLIKNGIFAVLGDNDLYLDYFDEKMNETHEPVTCHISENLADTYQDLKDFIEIYKLANEDVSLIALNKCILAFAEHWGYKLLASVKILHILNFLGPENESENSNSIISDKKTNNKGWFISKAQQDYKNND